MSSEDLTEQAVYQGLFENSKSVMLILDPGSGAILDANKAALLFYGYTKKELIGKEMSDINTLSKDRVKKEMASSLREKQNYFNFRHQMKDGTIKDVEVYSGPIKLKDKKVLYSIVNDISEKKKVQHALEESESTIKAMINATQSLVFLGDIQGNIINLNTPAGRMLGSTPDKIIGKNINTFFPENDVSRMLTIAQKVVDLQQPLHYQRDRGDKFYDVCFYPVFNTTNEVDRICVFANDITDLKKTEKVFAAVETAGGICHEMNQPLQVLLGNLELLKLNIPESDPNTKIIDLLIRQTEKIGSITRQLTNITRYETKEYMKGTIFDIDKSSQKN